MTEIATDRGGPPRRRWLLATAALGVVGLGLVARGLPGATGDLAGGALYAVLVTLLLALVAPAARPVRLGAVALAVCAVVELAQLTGVPARVVDVLPPLRYVLGTTFHAPDLAAYVVGAGAAAVGLTVAGDRAVRRAQVAPDRGR